MNRRKYAWIGIAVLLCFLMSASLVNAEIICEGDVAAQDVVSNTWDFTDNAGTPTYGANKASYFYYDCAMKPTEMSFNAYDVRAKKMTAARWHYDPANPTADIIPDSVVDTCAITYSGNTVGTAIFTIKKIGSCDGTPNDADGYTNMFIDAEITNFSTIPASGDIVLAFTPSNDIDTYYDAFWGQYFPTMETNMKAIQGFHFFMTGTPIHNTLGGRGTAGCPDVDYWYLQSYYNFKNYYEVNTNPTNITVDVQRAGGDLGNYGIKSKLRIYDQYGLILTESAWHTTNQTYTLADVPQYMFLVPDFGDKSTELFICDYQSQDTAKIYGTIYNAENESTITSAKVQIDAHHSTYSDDSGFYLIRTDYGANHIITASKDGYWDWQETIYFDYAGDYEIDIPLIPKPPSHTGHGILGTVRTLPYYLPIENQLVSIENASWSNSTTTNNVGYYIFDDLEVGNYWINASKDGYRDNNQSVTVSATGDEIETIDNCDATTNWSSDNSLTLNTTDKQEGTGSLQSSGSSTLDFNKSAPTAIDASNVTKSNGYMALWYKVNDTTRITDYLVFTVGSDGDNATNKISWGVHKSNFVNDTWKEIWLKFSDGTETGTLNMSNISWIEVKAAKSDSVISKIDNIRFYDFSYEIHDVDLDPILSLGIIAKTLSEDVIASFTAILDSTSLNTTSGEELIFTDLSYGMKELTVTSEGYFPYQCSVYLDSNTNITAYMQEGAEGGAGAYYPPPHLVEFRVVDVWGAPLSDVTVNATGFETTVVNLSWWQKAFGYDAEVEVYNSTMNGTTDSVGHISFLMVETIKYKIWFTNASQNISAYREIYPKDERYTITIGEVPTQKIAYWITSEQNDIANTGNITLHYSDYNSPVKTNWVNFSIYFLDNETLAYTHNFTTINETNENTSTNLNASYSYKIKCVADHEGFGVFTWFVTVVFIMPEKPKLPVVQTLKDSLEDWQLQTFSLFVIILFALIFGAYSSGVGGMVVSFTAVGFHLFGMMPLVPTLAGAVVYPLIAVMAIINLLSEQKGSAEV